MGSASEGKSNKVEETMSQVTEIICGICFKPIKVAMTLHCHHHFCLACIQSTVILGDNNSAEIVCVLCGFSTVVDDFDPLLDPDLDREIALIRSGIKKTFMCQWCDAVPATMQCNTCAAAYCNECMNFVHKHSARTKHTIGPLVDTPNSFLLRCSCPGHEDYKAEFFCTDCDTLCCAYCLRVSPHFEHRNTEIAVAALETKRKIAAQKVDMDRMKSRLDETALEIKELANRYDSSYRESLSGVAEKFANYRRELDNLEADLCSRIDKLYVEGKNALQSSRLDFLTKMNTFLVALLNIEGSSTDSKVLENAGFLKKFLSSNSQYLPLAGKCFMMDVEASLELPEIAVRLDLQSDELALQIGCGPDAGRLVTPDETLAPLSFSSVSRSTATLRRQGGGSGGGGSGSVQHGRDQKPPRASFLDPSASPLGKLALDSPMTDGGKRRNEFSKGRRGENFRSRRGRYANEEDGEEEEDHYDDSDRSSDSDGQVRGERRGRYTRPSRRRAGGQHADEEGDGRREYRPPPQPSSTSLQYWGRRGEDKSMSMLDRFLNDNFDSRQNGSRENSLSKSPRQGSGNDVGKRGSSRNDSDRARERREDMEVDEMVVSIVEKVRQNSPSMFSKGGSMADSGSPQNRLSPGRRRRSFAPKETPPPSLPLQDACPALRHPLRFTFPVDDDVDMVSLPEGLQFRCIARGNPTIQIGLRSAETLSEVTYRFREDKGMISWRLRLDHVADLFVGVVEYGSPAGTSGFFWKPACEKVLDGELGRVTGLADKLPVCHTGDVIGFLYNSNKRTLRLFVNNEDFGEVVTDLPGNVGACFILYPGETVTVLY